jgi:tetratricopeptide (TPR) repeat protein
VHVLTVVPELTGLAATLKMGPTAQAVAEHKDRWRHDFEQFLTGFKTDGVVLTREIRHGIPHEEIAASAAEHNADVIVMGTNGRTGLARLLMGSVARRVLRRMPCSLWTVKKLELAQEQQFAQDLQHIRLLMAEGRAFLESGQFRPALAKFRQVSQRNPLHAEALQGQAAAYEGLGQHEEARVFRSRAEKALEPAVEVGVGG